MVKYREIKLYGNTYIIKLNTSDLKDLDIKVGDFVDIDDLVIKKKENK